MELNAIYTTFLFSLGFATIPGFVSAVNVINSIFILDQGYNCSVKRWPWWDLNRFNLSTKGGIFFLIRNYFSSMLIYVRFLGLFLCHTTFSVWTESKLSSFFFTNFALKWEVIRFASLVHTVKRYNDHFFWLCYQICAFKVVGLLGFFISPWRGGWVQRQWRQQLLLQPFPNTSCAEPCAQSHQQLALAERCCWAAVSEPAEGAKNIVFRSSI